MMPRPLIYLLLVVSALTLLPLAYLLLARNTDSGLPRIQVVFDMDDQAYHRPQSRSDVFPDGRAARPYIDGTVARGELRLDRHFYFGLADGDEDGDWAETLPVPLSSELLARGRERYEIFCAACHGLTGGGDGMVHRRARDLTDSTWTPPADLTAPVTAVRADGELFSIITGGVREMAAYGAQIPPVDRWAIVAHLRVLQRAANGDLDDVPADLRRDIEQGR